MGHPRCGALLLDPERVTQQADGRQMEAGGRMGCCGPGHCEHAGALSPVVALSSLIRICRAAVCSESSNEMGPPVNQY